MRLRPNWSPLKNVLEARSSPFRLATPKARFSLNHISNKPHCPNTLYKRLVWRFSLKDDAVELQCGTPKVFLPSRRTHTNSQPALPRLR